MWRSRSRSRRDDERYREKTADRLRGIGMTSRTLSDVNPMEVRERLGRMAHGTIRLRPSETPG